MRHEMRCDMMYYVYDSFTAIQRFTLQFYRFCMEDLQSNLDKKITGSKTDVIYN